MTHVARSYFSFWGPFCGTFCFASTTTATSSSSSAPMAPLIFEGFAATAEADGRYTSTPSFSGQTSCQRVKCGGANSMRVDSHFARYFCFFPHLSVSFGSRYPRRIVTRAARAREILNHVFSRPSWRWRYPEFQLPRLEQDRRQTEHQQQVREEIAKPSQ